MRKIVVAFRKQIEQRHVAFFHEFAHRFQPGAEFPYLSFRGRGRRASGHYAVHMGHASAEYGRHFVTQGSDVQRFQILIEHHARGGLAETQIRLFLPRREGRFRGALKEVLTRKLIEAQQMGLQKVGALH